MNIAELIEHLSTFDDDLEVVVSADPEGNRFSKVSDLFAVGEYKDGEFREAEDYDPDAFDSDEIDEEDIPIVNSIVLFPED